MTGSTRRSRLTSWSGGAKRWLALLLVVAVAGGLAGPGLPGGGPAGARLPGHGPGQRWGDAAGLSHLDTEGRGNTGEPKSLQSRYPSIAGQPDPAPAGNEAHTVDAAAAGEVRGFDAATSRELPEKRRRTERTFANTDGTQTTEFGRDPINYQRPDGSWQPIDTSLVPKAKNASPAEGWRNAADSVGRWLAPTADGAAIARVELDERHRLEFGVDGVRAAAGQVAGSAVTYQAVRPGADLTLEVTSIGLKESIVLRSADAPQSWLFPLRLTGLTASIVDQTIVFKDERGQVRARVPQGFMVDSKFDEHIGNGATSYGVRYELVDLKGQPALRMDLDSAWLRDPARVFPVTVDPSVDLRDAPASMYVQRSSNGPDFSRADGELKAGHATDTAGSYLARTYIAFPGVESALANHRIFGAQLGITNYWSWSCNARPVWVYPVVEPWNAGPGWSWPGPAVADRLPDVWPNFAHGYIPHGSSRSSCPTATETINLGWAGRDLVQRWVSGQQPNYGLGVRTDESDVYSWKKFTGAGTANPPRLAVTHSPYNAAYQWDSAVPNPPVTRTQGGRVKLTVTNWSAGTWDTGSYALAYRYFDANGGFIGSAEAASLPRNIARGESVPLDALIQPLPPGTYRFEFSMLHRNVAWFTDEQVAPAAMVLRVIDVPPVIKAQYPPNGYSAPTLTPTLWAQGVDVDAPPNSSLQYRFEVCQPGPANCFDSGRRPSSTWTVPVGRLQWGKSYQWRVFAWDGTSESAALPFSTLLTAVPQPEITAHLGNALYSGGNGQFDPQVGNYTTSAIDATVTSIGPKLSVARTYNSLDPRRSGAFGAGWSSLYDMRLVQDGDGSGNVVVTYPDGQQARYGANRTAGGQPDGGPLVAPQGRFATLVPQPGGGWKLTDKSGTAYVFAADGRLTEIDDSAGRAVQLGYGADGKLATATNRTSNRALRFTWTGSHVSKVDTDPIDGAQLSWTYTYDGDRLTRVCDPNNGCTRYDSTPGSHYRSVVLDSRPDSYWRLGERSGTDAASQVSLNLGADKARYANVGQGSPGVLTGTDDPAAGFNGTSSVITLPDGAVRKSLELSIELWFKTGTGGPLFGMQNAPQGSAATSTVPVLYIGNDGKLRGQFWIGQANPITTAGTVTDNNWHHVVLTSSVDTQTLYLDGQPVGTRSGAIDNSTFSHAQIGSAYSILPSGWPQWGSTDRRFFNGSIDEVAIYQHPLGAPTIQAHLAARGGTDHLSRTTLPSGKLAAQLSYDTALDRLTQYIDRNGGAWSLGAPVTTGDPTNIIRTVRVADPGNRAHFYDYDPVRGRILRYLAPLGMDTRPEDKPPTTTPPPGGGGSFPPVEIQGARIYDYDPNGFQSTIYDENASTITLVNDARGNITSRITCRTGPTDCQTAYYEYPPAGSNPSDPRLDKMIAARDARSSGPADNRFRTVYSYTPAGELDTQTTPDGGVVRHTYTTGSEPAFGGSGTTPPGLVATTTDPRNAITRYAYFATGDLAEVRAPSGLITRFTYDALGRQLTRTEVSDSYPGGVTITSGHDQVGHLVSVTGPGIANAVTGVTHTARGTANYDADGNPTRIEESDLTGSDPTRVTQLSYDSHNQVERITDPEGGETSFGYDPFGNRTRMVNPAGVHFDYAYTARNALAEIRLRGWNGDPDSPAEPDPASYLVLVSYAYDLAGQLVRQTDAMGRATRYRYFSDGLLRQVMALNLHNPNGSTRNLILSDLLYDAAGNLAKETRAGGQVTTFEVDAVGRRTASTDDPAGLARRTALSYDLAGNVTRVAMSGKESNTGIPGDGAAEVVDYGYDGAGRQSSQTVHTGTEDLTTLWGYDQRGLLTSITDPRGTAAFTTNLGYDQLGRRVTTTAPPVSVETVGTQPVTQRPTSSAGYDTFGNATEIVDANGQTWHAGYDKAGRLTSSTSPSYTPPGSAQPITAINRLEYDPQGRVTKATNPRGAVTRYSYDQLGRLVDRTDPNPDSPADAGGVWRFTYTRTGEPLSTTDPTSARTEATYDDLGRQLTASVLERRPQPGTFTTTFGYDDASNLTSVAAPSTATSQYSYDLLGQLTKVTSPSNVVTQLGYDRSGRLIKTVDAAGRAHRSTFDLAGRATAETDFAPDGSQLRQALMTYDRAGNPATATDPLGHATRMTVDAANRPAQLVQPVSSTESITTSFGYDAAGNRTRYTDGRGNITNYTVNSWGLPESLIEPSTTAHPNPNARMWTVGYDTAGNPVTSTAPGGVSRAAGYDGLDRLTQLTGSGAESPTTTKTLGYDALGQLTSSSAPGGTNTFTYNDRGSLLTTAGPSGASSLDYDSDGNLLSRTDAAGIARFGYLKGRLNTAQDGLTGSTQTLGYNTSGQLSTIDYGGGRTRTFGYDNLARLTGDTLASNGTQTSSITYGYDLSNWLGSKTTTGSAGAGSNTYAYDFSGRLTSWTKDGSTTSYGWDAANNRTSAGSRTATFDERNRLTNDGSSSYTYTPRGTVATKTTGASTEPFSFDAFDRLVSQGPTSYAYDALDRVVTRNSQQFGYTGASNELATDATTKFSRSPAGELLALGTGTTNRLTVADQHGDVIGGFDPAAATTALTDSVAFDPFGQPTNTTGTRRPIGYQGDYTDPDTGNVNMTARWYNPSSGAFTSRDTYGPDNRYTYVAGSPLNYSDPSGHSRDPGSNGSSDPRYKDLCTLYSQDVPDCDPHGGSGGRAGSGLGGGGGGCGRSTSGEILTYSDCCDEILTFGNCDHDYSQGTGSGGGGGIGTGHGGGVIHGPGKGKGKGGKGGAGGHGPAPRPDPAIAAREANRIAARNNPLPIPPALLAPMYGNSSAPPVSSAPDVPSREVGDYRDDVDDVNDSYQELQNSLTVPSETVLGHVKATVSAPSEVMQIGDPVTPYGCRPLTGDIYECPGRDGGGHNAMSGMDPHTAMGLGGMIPGWGILWDLADSGTYFSEGDWVNGLLSLGFAIPGPGDVARGVDEVKDGKNIFRGMKEEGGLPKVEPTARGLGARPGKDIPVDKDGMVHPGTGGMSVTPDDPANLPPFRRPEPWGGKSKDPVWCTNTCQLPPGLKYVQDSPTHGTIQPDRVMPLEEYQRLLESTRPLWERATPPIGTVIPPGTV